MCFSTVTERGRFRFRFLENGSGGSSSENGSWENGSWENGSNGSGFRFRFGSWATLYFPAPELWTKTYGHEGFFSELRDSSAKSAEQRSANKGLPPPLGRGVCETKFKNGRSRPRKPFISSVFCAQRGLRPWSRQGPDHGVGVDPETVNHAAATRGRQKGIGKKVTKNVQKGDKLFTKSDRNRKKVTYPLLRTPFCGMLRTTFHFHFGM